MVAFFCKCKLASPVLFFCSLLFCSFLWSLIRLNRVRDLTLVKQWHKIDIRRFGDIHYIVGMHKEGDESQVVIPLSTSAVLSMNQYAQSSLLIYFFIFFPFHSFSFLLILFIHLLTHSFLLSLSLPRITHQYASIPDPNFPTSTSTTTNHVISHVTSQVTIRQFTFGIVDADSTLVYYKIHFNLSPPKE